MFSDLQEDMDVSRDMFMANVLLRLFMSSFFYLMFMFSSCSRPRVLLLRTIKTRKSVDPQIFSPAVQTCKVLTPWWRGSHKCSTLNKEPSRHLLSFICVQLIDSEFHRFSLSIWGTERSLVSFQLHHQPENPRGAPIREPQQKATNRNQMLDSVFIRWLRS